MEKLFQSRLASVLTILVGVWLLLSPIWISVTGAALTSLFITAGVITLAGLVQLFWTNSTPSWINAVAAIWLFISAFAFTMSNGMAWNEVISAIVVFILATWDGVEISQVEAYRRHHPAGV